MIFPFDPAQAIPRWLSIPLLCVVLAKRWHPNVFHLRLHAGEMFTPDEAAVIV
jgi:hypothetical protein